jgi:hypothetical protein
VLSYVFVYENHGVRFQHAHREKSFTWMKSLQRQLDDQKYRSEMMADEGVLGQSILT